MQEPSVLVFKSKTPIDLYYESKMRGGDIDDFMMAFVIAGYTEEQLLEMNKTVDKLKLNPLENIAFARGVAERCDCVDEYNKIMEKYK